MSFHVLLIKTSSLGDIIHTLPALTDAAKNIKGIKFDWLVEENFQEIPAWHPAVNKVIPVALRRWKKNIFRHFLGSEWRQFKQQLRAQHYDVIIDAQGLLKSALLGKLAKGEIYGLDGSSAKEPIASFFYQFPQKVKKDQHAVERVRQLFAQALAYKLPIPFDYGIKAQLVGSSQKLKSAQQTTSKIIFFHGTTWQTKHWPISYWIQLAKLLSIANIEVLLPWGSESEKYRAALIKNSIADNNHLITILPKLNLQQLALLLLEVKAVVAVDTGLAHLAAALAIPMVSLFGPTQAALTRPYASQQQGLQACLEVDFSCKACLKKDCDLTEIDHNMENIHPACYTSLTPNKVKQAIDRLIER